MTQNKVKEMIETGDSPLSLGADGKIEIHSKEYFQLRALRSCIPEMDQQLRVLQKCQREFMAKWEDDEQISYHAFQDLMDALAQFQVCFDAVEECLVTRYVHDQGLPQQAQETAEQAEARKKNAEAYGQKLIEDGKRQLGEHNELVAKHPDEMRKPRQVQEQSPMTVIKECPQCDGDDGGCDYCSYTGRIEVPRERT